MIPIHVTKEALDLLEEATKRGIYIELRDEELHTFVTDTMSQEDLNEFTTRLTPHRDAVAAVIVYFGLAEQGGVH